MKATEDRIKSLFTEEYIIACNRLNEMGYAFVGAGNCDPARNAITSLETKGDDIIKTSKFIDGMAIAVPIVKGTDVAIGVPLIERLHRVIDVIESRIGELGKVATALHDMKLSKLQRAIRETELHAAYTACYRIRALASDCMNMLLNDPYPDPDPDPE